MLILSTWYFAAGLLIGMSAAAPIGPVNILVIQRALYRGLTSAMLLGVGAAMGDAVFAGVAALGLGFIKMLMNANQHILRAAGGVFMIGFGIVLWRQSPHVNDPGKPLPQARYMAIAIFLMTLTNPATILWFIAAFAMFRFELIGNSSPLALANSLHLVCGVFLGSILWWFGLTSFTVHWRSRLTDRHLVVMNHVAAAILIATGLVVTATTGF